MLHRRTQLALSAALMALLASAGCQKKEEGGPNVEPIGASPTMTKAQPEADLELPLVTVDEQVITVGEFQSQINRQAPYVRVRYTSREQKKEFLETLISFEIMAAEAKRRGFDKDPDVVRTLKQVMIQKLIKEEFTDQLTPADITEEELKAFYEENKAEYQRPDQVRAAVIVLNDKASANALIEEAKKTAKDNHVAFRNLVLAHSKDGETKGAGGDLGFFDSEFEGVPKPVIDAAFTLSPSEVSDVIEGGNGKFYILKTTGKRQAMSKSFEDVKRQLLNRVYRDKRMATQEAFVAGLKEKATITFVDENLDKIHIQAADMVDQEKQHGTLPDLRELNQPR